MHSIKNTVVAVLLLGASYGVYQVITTPDPTLNSKELIGDITYSDELVLENGLEIGTGTPGSLTEQTKTIELPEAIDNVAPPISVEPDKTINWANEEPEQAPRISAPQLQPPSLIDDNQSSRIEAPTQSTTSPAYNQLASNHSVNDQDLLQALKNSLNEVDRFDPEPQRSLTDVKPKPSDESQQFVSTTTPDPEALLNDFSPTPNATNAFPVEPANPALDDMSAVWPQISEFTKSGRYRKALTTLTRYYRSNLPEGQKTELLTWLDALARKVVYSSEHHFSGTPHKIVDGDHLNDLAEQWNVPAQLIYNINRDVIEDPSNLTSGRDLKIVKGPFHAEIDISDKVLTLFVQGQYAGRFNVESISSELQPGKLNVTGKFSNLESLRGQRTDFNEENPFWIGLGDRYAMSAPGDKNASIILDTKDAADVFGILNSDSTLTIYR